MSLSREHNIHFEDLPKEYFIKDIQISSLIGSGGQALIFSGTYAQEQDSFAIKVAKEPGEDELAYEAAVNTALVGVNNLARFRGFGLVPMEGKDHAAIVMDEYPDETVADKLLSKDGLQPVDAVRYAGYAALGLSEMHERGLVHRDVKPGNLLTSGEKVILADFGITTSYTDEGEQRVYGRVDSNPRPGMTGDGMVVGTAPYLSPERVKGEKSEPPSDTYALGLVVYEMFTQKRFVQPLGSPILEALTHIDPIESKVALSRANSTLQEKGLGAFVTPINQALRQDPDRRPDVLALGKDLVDRLADSTADRGARVRRRIFAPAVNVVRRAIGQAA